MANFCETLCLEEGKANSGRTLTEWRSYVLTWALYVVVALVLSRVCWQTYNL
jgi:hypothetical protein